MWHGTHHSAQKSTRTGVSESRTLVWNSVSVTAPMLAIVFSSRVRRASRRLRPGLERLARWARFPSCRGGVRLVLEEPLRIDRRLASLAGGGHRLTIDPVGDIARREDPVDGRVRCAARRTTMYPSSSSVQLVAEQRGVRRRGRSRRRRRRCGTPAISPGRGVAETDAGHGVVAEDLLHLRVPDHLDLRVGERPLLHDLRCAELVAPMDDRDLATRTS